MAWGYHLILDMGECSDKINSVDVVKEFLSTLVYKLKMHPIGGPIVVYVDWNEGRGVSGVQLITTSTITFHGDDNGKCVFLDVFSCTEYKPEVVLALVKEYFNPKNIHQKWIQRDASANSFSTRDTDICDELPIHSE